MKGLGPCVRAVIGQGGHRDQGDGRYGLKVHFWLIDIASEDKKVEERMGVVLS